MIQQEKYQQALLSLNSVLTRARWMASEVGASDLAKLLDAAEILPKYIAQSDDATEDFRSTVEDISNHFSGCSHIIGQFDQECACAW
jgi:hypothetical protein